MKKIHVCICCFHDVEIWLGKNCPSLTRSLLLRHYCYNSEVDNGSFNVFHCVISFVVESRWFAWPYYPPQINFRRHEKKTTHPGKMTNLIDHWLCGTLTRSLWPLNSHYAYQVLLFVTVVQFTRPGFIPAVETSQSLEFHPMCLTA